jgi:acyl-coenzyme A thioesterase PaaI-like protein
MSHNGARVTGLIRFSAAHEGIPGLAHGGAIAAALDETLGGMLNVLRTPAVTASLTVQYIAPVILHRELTLEAWRQRVDGRRLYLAARLHDAGEDPAAAEALRLTVAFEHYTSQGGDMPHVRSIIDPNRAAA